MAFVLRAVALLAMMPAVSGAFTCADGWTDLGGTPRCVGLTSDTCSAGTCCKKTSKMCADYSAAWVGAQLLGQGCAVDTKFFDTKKMAAVVGGSQGDDDIKAACCTAFSDAKCSDWPMLCTGGKYNSLTTAAPADTGDPKTGLSQTKFQETCCKVPAKCSSHSCSSGMSKIANADSQSCGGLSCSDGVCCNWGTTKNCASVSVAWLGAQILGQGCAVDDKFFDTKKLTTAIGGSQADDDIKAACCTPFAEATCFDWPKGCAAAGDLKAGADVGAPADGKGTLTQAKFGEYCCKKPMKCADATAAGSEASAGLPIACPLAGTLVSLMVLVGVHMAGPGF